MSDHLKELLGVLYTPGAAEVSREAERVQAELGTRERAERTSSGVGRPLAITRDFSGGLRDAILSV